MQLDSWKMKNSPAVEGDKTHLKGFYQILEQAVCADSYSIVVGRDEWNGEQETRGKNAAKLMPPRTDDLLLSRTPLSTLGNRLPLDSQQGLLLQDRCIVEGRGSPSSPPTTCPLPLRGVISVAGKLAYRTS